MFFPRYFLFISNSWYAISRFAIKTYNWWRTWYTWNIANIKKKIFRENDFNNCAIRDMRVNNTSSLQLIRITRRGICCYTPNNKQQRAYVYLKANTSYYLYMGYYLKVNGRWLRQWARSSHSLNRQLLGIKPRSSDRAGNDKFSSRQSIYKRHPRNLHGDSHSGGGI